MIWWLAKNVHNWYESQFFGNITVKKEIETTFI